MTNYQLSDALVRATVEQQVADAEARRRARELRKAAAVPARRRLPHRLAWKPGLRT
jgi:hypothetical protein